MNDREHQIYKAISKYLKLKYPKIIFRFDMAGNNLSKAASGKNKDIQKFNGYPDLFIAQPTKDFSGLFIEIKKEGTKLRNKSGDWATEHIKEQNDVLLELRLRGYFATFGIGTDDCINVIEEYLKQ